MSIDFENDVFPLYASNVVVDPEYIAIDPDRRDNPQEQKILTMIEVMRGMMAELETDEHARMFHYAMGRMLAGMSNSEIYEDGRKVTVAGNVKDPHVGLANGDEFTIAVDGGAATTVTLAAAPYADLAALVTELNGAITAPEIEAVAEDSRLMIKTVAGQTVNSVEIGYGASAAFLTKTGLRAMVHNNPIVARANESRDDALAHFEREVNPK